MGIQLKNQLQQPPKFVQDPMFPVERDLEDSMDPTVVAGSHSCCCVGDVIYSMLRLFEL
jgi:hypothetical protein